MSGYLTIRNWDKWQTYRKDRQQPPWIKLHRALLRDPNWIALSDAQRGQLVAIWMLAADKHGRIPSDPSLLQRMCFMTKAPDIKLLIAHGFLDATVTPERRQGDALEENRVEADKMESGADTPTTKRSSLVPENWLPGEPLLSSLETNGGFPRKTIWEEVPKFVDHHRAKGSLFRDHDAAFRTWMRKSREFAAKDAKGGARQNGSGVVVQGSFRKELPPEPPRTPLSPEEIERRRKQTEQVIKRSIRPA